MRGERATSLAAAAWLAALAPAVAHAGEPSFWQEVREPGLREYRARVAEARAALGQRRIDAAAAAAAEAVALLPDRPEAHVVLGRALGESAQLAAAAAAFERAHALDPRAFDGPGDGAHAAELAASAEAWPLAREILARAVGRMRPSAERTRLYLLLGDVSLTLGPAHLPDAVAAYREVMRSDTRPDARVLLGLALALRRAGEATEPLDLAREAAALGHVEARLRNVAAPPAERAARLALALEAIGDVEGARHAWEEAARGVWRAHADEERARLGGGGRR